MKHPTGRTSPVQLNILCPAKINLALEILGRRTDGYHEIRTILQTIAFCDELILEQTGSGGIQLEVKGDISASIPSDSKNLIIKAYRAFRDQFGGAPPLKAILKKRIPPGSGLGGGSSDAAGMLLGLDLLAGESVGRERLQAAARSIGTDVPFFIEKGTVFCSGRGDRLRTVSALLPPHVLLVFPPFGIATSKAYEEASGLLTSLANDNSIHLCFNEKGEFCPSREHQRNDLEIVVFRSHPDMVEVKESLYRGGALMAAMSGSGSALFGLFHERQQAVNTGCSLELKGYRAVVTRILERETCGIPG